MGRRVGRAAAFKRHVLTRGTSLISRLSLSKGCEAPMSGVEVAAASIGLPPCWRGAVASRCPLHMWR
eukprot:2428063-Alexandrium_andersonii.AAC.1